MHKFRVARNSATAAANSTMAAMAKHAKAREDLKLPPDDAALAQGRRRPTRGDKGGRACDWIVAAAAGGAFAGRAPAACGCMLHES